MDTEKKGLKKAGLGYLSLFLILVFIDQITKFIIGKYIAYGEEKVIIKDFFVLNHVKNKGAAWGFLADKTWGIYFLSVISGIVTLVLLYIFLKHKVNKLRFALCLLISGSVGNLIDRIRIGEVTDFLSFQFGQYYFPSFNVADICVVCGTFSLILVFIFDKKLLQEIM